MGQSGDPSVSPTKLRELIKMQQPIEQPSPKFIRDNLTNEDIQGSKSRPLYRGSPREIMQVKDIQGTRPQYEKVRISGVNGIDET